MSNSTVFVNRADHGLVRVLTLNRPERSNALGGELIDQLSDALSHAELDGAVRAVVITGTGRVFCAGMDLRDLGEPNPSDATERSEVARAQAIADLLSQVHHFPKPTIAALNGAAVAGGAGLATACDFVIAADTAQLGYPETRRGLVPAMVLHDLVRQVGERRARALLLAGTPITADEAHEWGLVNRVVPAEACLAEAIALGRSLLGCGPRAIETTKRLIAEASGQPHDLRGGAAILAQVRVSAEAQEGIRAFLERRPPEWETRAGGGRDGSDR
jgi:methylglutaconyl-CoA hydratase